MMIRRIAVFIIPLIFMISSCKNLIDLDPFEYNTYPLSRNQFIEVDEPVWVEFHDTVNSVEAEDAVKVASESGRTECHYTWEDHRLILTPANPWTPGTRYTLTIEGQFNLMDGRIFNVAETIPFFAGTPGAIPKLVYFSPNDEAMASLDEEVILTFSKPMDTASFENNFRISPNMNMNYIWSANSETVTITPKDAWNGLTRYTVSIPDTITDTDNIPLVESYEFNFRTFLDINPPELRLSVPWDIPGDTPIITETLNQIDNTKGIYLEFDGTMDWSVFDNSWEIYPATAFSLLTVNEKAVAFIPEDPWVPEQEFTLTLTTELSDEAGNKILTPQDIVFTCPIPVQKVNRISHTPTDADTDLSTGSPGGVHPLTVTTDIEPKHSFTLHLDVPITNALLPSFVQTISFETVFPSTLSTPSLNSVSMVSRFEILLIYSGFEEPDTGSGISHYYKLRQNADRDKTITEDGSYVVDDWEVVYKIES